jgi:hypothetical protein
MVNSVKLTLSQKVKHNPFEVNCLSLIVDGIVNSTTLVFVAVSVIKASLMSYFVENERHC